MRRFGMILAGALLACTAQQAPLAGISNPGAAATEGTSPSAADDERCARDSFVTFLTAVNKGNRALLTPLLDGEFMWVTVQGSTTYDARDAVERLLAVSRSGQQWELRRPDVNGRGWHGGIDFGFVIRHTGRNVPEPRRDAAGKGVIECPGGGIRLFGLGDSA